MTKAMRLAGIIVGIAILVSAIVGTGTYFLVNHINNSRALSGTISSIGNMLRDSNTVEYSTYQKLLTALGNDTTSTRNKSAINGGTPVVFQMGTVNNKAINWQVVYQTGDIITVWMTDCYTINEFNDKDAAIENSALLGYANGPYDDLGNYSKSVIRDLSKAIYKALDTTYPVISKVVESPQEASIQWQKDCTSTVGQGQPDITYVNNTSYKAHHNGLQSANGTASYTSWTWDSTVYNDKFWIPSYYEVFNTSTSSSSINGGLWGLTATDRGFTNTRLDNGATANGYCWLRSGSL